MSMKIKKPINKKVSKSAENFNIPVLESVLISDPSDLSILPIESKKLSKQYQKSDYFDFFGSRQTNFTKQLDFWPSSFQDQKTQNEEQSSSSEHPVFQSFLQKQQYQNEEKSIPTENSISYCLSSLKIQKYKNEKKSISARKQSSSSEHSVFHSFLQKQQYQNEEKSIPKKNPLSYSSYSDLKKQKFSMLGQSSEDDQKNIDEKDENVTESKDNYGYNVLEFEASIDDMLNFVKYIEKIKEKCADSAGLAKIIPLKRMSSTNYRKSTEKSNIEIIYKQKVNGLDDVYFIYNIDGKKSYSLLDFELHCNFYRPFHMSEKQLEKDFWNYLTSNKVLIIFGSNQKKTLFNNKWRLFDLKYLNNNSITQYIYYGMWRSMFAIHTENQDLILINYHHFGAPKFWYSIPPNKADDLKNLIEKLCTQGKTKCATFFKNKIFLSPKILRKHKIPFNLTIQKEGEFIVIFPKTYYQVFDAGFNCSETINFKIEDWMQYSQNMKINLNNKSKNAGCCQFINLYICCFSFLEELSNFTIAIIFLIVLILFLIIKFTFVGFIN